MAGERLYNLISDILDISKLKQGEITLNFKAVDLHTAVAMVIYVLDFTIKCREVSICNNVAKDLPAIWVDEERVMQILYNLIGNAVKFTEKGSILINAEERNGWIEISIKDTGIGISKEKIDFIFDPFVQGHGDASRSYEGVGLGLPITQKLVELHGGTIKVESELNKGSVFIFTLPMSSQPASRKRISLHKKSGSEHTENITLNFNGFNGFSILVADDDTQNLRVISIILATEGYSIQCVNNGQAAIDLLSQGNRFDLLLLDIMMPVVTGFDVLKRLREKYFYVDLPVLILTARTMNEDIEVAFDLGANDFLGKPFEAKELRARVRTLVQLKSLVRDRVTSELAFLHAQIKPHFIYNALSVISSLSTINPKKAKELVINLSNYLRGSFDFEHNDGMTTLNKELELVRAYLAIEQARFKERLEVEFAVDRNVNCTIPTLSIQPLVENAVRHGIMPTLEGGRVNILVRTEGNFIKIAVRNNGMGIEDDLLKTILSENGKKGSVGIKNINKRLINLYGKGIEITTGTDGETTVSFMVPINKAG